MCPIRPRNKLAALALLLIASVAGAQQKPLPIHIESDRARLLQTKGTSTYTGDVVLTRGGLTLTGDKLTITRINQRSALRAKLVGGPAHLDKQPDRTGEDIVTGHAHSIEYANANATLVMRGDAVVERQGDRVTGEVIRHNLDSGRTQAERGDNADQRVHITINPDNYEQDTQ